MRLKIEKIRVGEGRPFRLMGRIQSEHLAELENQVSRAGMAVDPDEVTLNGIDAVRFLGECEANGIELLRYPPICVSGSSGNRKERSKDAKNHGQNL